ncbi:hypothetical protein ACSS6W_004440 [Trichoderma asperelloides]|uniref:INO80 complex subunit 3 n=1 Tax=Trichoderma asperellum TaxID=101201 RepID=A0A6V8QX41_TRIAP|nr:hypothetical protein TASIC1_0007050100 [Trichoderma asperellum]
MADSPAKADGGSERRPAGYKSWKKKYRKMRIVFDQKMHECEELHKQEAKAASTVKRLAIENDRLLDLLLEVNNSPQIPPERRIDLSLEPPSDSSAPCLPIDRERKTHKDEAMKKLNKLLDIPHPTYSSAKESKSAFLADLSPLDGESHPAHFLSADDIDDYIYLIDTGLDPDSALPTMAPLAHPAAHAPSNPQAKNPTSVTNWLRKHAPKIFLQDGETHGDADDEAGAGAGPGSGHSSARKPRGSAKGERGGGKAGGGGKGKKTGAASRISAAERGDADASMDDDGEFAATPVTARSKRKRDDDAGYKPRGSSSRPTKKKRKSDVEATPTVRKSKKEAAANKDD